MKTRLLRFRLATNILALALTLGVLAVTPVAADDNFELEGGGTWTCEAACWSWNSSGGCTDWHEGCSNTDGRWFCRPLPN